MRSQLNWTQYRALLQIEDAQKREYCELESVNPCWTARETERQIHSRLWERLLLSNDRESVLAVARRERIPESPREVVKDPMMLEFLGLERKPRYYETSLEQAIIDHLQEFILELGNGFLFSARQRRILLDDDEVFVDLVFYNRLLRCFVLLGHPPPPSVLPSPFCPGRPVVPPSRSRLAAAVPSAALPVPLPTFLFSLFTARFR